MPRSFSQLQTYQTCPRQFEYGYVKKLPRGGISAGESFGTSMHSALKRWGELERGRGDTGDRGHRGDKRDRSDQLKLFTEDVPQQSPELSMETLLHFWKQSFVVEGYESRVEADYALRRGEGILQMYFAWWQQKKHHVLAVEKGFKLVLDSVVLSGRFDRVEQGDAGIKILDFKTSKPRTQEQVDADLQLSVYALACEEVFDEPCAELCFLFLNEESITEVLTTRSKGQLADAKKQISFLDERILSADFHPTPGRDVCKRCPYRNVCDVAV